MSWRRITTAALAGLLAATVLAPSPRAEAARRSFPSGWVNPSGTAQFEDWDFGRCSGAYLSGQAHLGTDSQGAEPSGVRAMAAGTVVNNVSWGASWGRALAVEHRTAGGARFLAVYGHVDASVGVGTRVAAGQQIGTLHNLGANTHLHLGIRPMSAGENASAVPVKGMSGCPANLLGYVNPIPWLAGQRPAGSTTPAPAPSGRWATVRTWTAPWSVRTRTGPSTSHAQNGSYADGARVLVVCQWRNGQAITDYYGPKGKAITWRVWNKSSTGKVWPDLYSDLPANPGLPNC